MAEIVVKKDGLSAQLRLFLDDASCHRIFSFHWHQHLPEYKPNHLSNSSSRDRILFKWPCCSVSDSDTAGVSSPEFESPSISHNLAGNDTASQSHAQSNFNSPANVDRPPISHAQPGSNALSYSHAEPASNR
jgi:hypothetical protein